MEEIVNTTVEVAKNINELSCFHIALGGFLGGVVSYFTTLNIKGNEILSYNGMEKLIGKILFIALIINGIIGVAGSFAIIGFLDWIDKLSSKGGEIELIPLFGISIIAGFASRSILPSLADKLDKDLISKVEKNETNIKEVDKKIQIDKKITENIEIAKELLSNNIRFVEGDVKQAIKRLEDNLINDPTNRLSLIWLGRLYEEKLNDAKSAIDETNKYLVKFKKCLTGDKFLNEDYAAGLYNLACYEAVYAKQNENNNEILNEYLERSKKHLIEALSFDIEIKKDIKSDINYDENTKTNGDLEILKEKGYIDDEGNMI